MNLRNGRLAVLLLTQKLITAVSPIESETRELHSESWRRGTTKHLHPRLTLRLLLFSLFALLSLGFGDMATPRANFPSSRPGEPDAGVNQRISTAYGRMPLWFEKNEGQTDPRVEFLSRGPGYTLFLSAGGEAALALSGPASAGKDTLDSFRSVKVATAGATLPNISSNARASRRDTGAALIVKPVGANKKTYADGNGPLPGTVNYLRGNDPTKWRTGISTYARVSYKNVYPGVDLVYYGNQRQLEYDFIVHPGADPGIIGLDFEGADGLTVDPEGDLVVQIAGREVRQRRPLIYQEEGGVRHEIAGRYMLTGKRTVRFGLSAYDTTKPLVIDPVLAYSTFLGGNGNDSGLAIAVDAAGSAYVTGQTISSDFPTTGAYDSSSNGNFDVFVTKLDSSGTVLLYSTYIGGSNLDQDSSIAVDAEGSAYVTGQTISSDFPTTGAFDTTYNGSGDVFVTKLNSTGTALVYSTFLGGGSVDDGNSIAVDAEGSAYVTGTTSSSNFPTTGAFDTTYNGGGDVFVTKLNSTGTALVYSTFLGGGSGDRGESIAVDATGSAYVTGRTDFSDFPTTPDAFDTTYNGGGDVFVTKLDSTGTALVFSTYIGGSGADDGTGIAVDAAGNAHVVGLTFTGFGFPTTAGAYNTIPNGGLEVFVTKLDSTGTALVYSTYLGGSSNDGGSSSFRAGVDMALDVAGNVYVTGQTGSIDFPTTPDAFDTTFNGLGDVFVTKLNVTGAALVYSTFLGGSLTEGGQDVAVDAAGGVFVTGETGSINFPTTALAYDTTINVGTFDGFVTKFFLSAPNTAPTITAAGAVTRQQDAGVSNSIIATVSDTEDAETVLAVTVDGFSSATVNGVTVSGIATDSAGHVTANVAAACGATGASFTLRVTDTGSLFAEATLNVAVTLETTPPVINPISNVVVTLPLNSVATSMPVTFPLPTATDNCSSASVVTSPVSGAVFNVGTTTVNVTATDGVGNISTSSFTVTVLYNFAGFFQPVDNPPTFNTANAGQAIPVKFSLSGNKGANIFAAGYPTSVAIACPSGSGALIEEIVANAIGSFLLYDSGTDRYNYVWKTDASWAGTCRQLIVKLNDGTTYTANFQFR